MDPISLFLERDILPEEKFEAKKVQRKAPWSWLFKDRKLYKRSFSGPYLFCVHPRHQNHFWRSYMKGFVGVTQEEDPYLIGLLLRDTDGQACKRRYRNMLRNVISVKGLR